VKHTEPLGQSAVVVHGATQVGTMHTVGPSTVGTQAHPPGQENVEQVSAVGQKADPESDCAETLVTEPTIIGATYPTAPRDRDFRRISRRLGPPAA
jgi:hypothetical protein